MIAGLTRFATRAHIARAALEATAYQTRDVVDAMAADSGVRLAALQIDGGDGGQRTADAVPGGYARRAP